MTNLKTCKWCGRTFRVPKRREFNATKYCCIKCSYYAYLENHLEAVRRYNKRYGLKNQKRLGDMGLGSHREEDFEKELKKIKAELRRLKL